MLIARGQKELREATLRWALAFGRGIWCKVIESQGLALDTRFVPAAPGPPKQRLALVLVARGGWTSHTLGPGSSPGETVPAPIAMALSLEQLEGAHRRRTFTYCTDGDPCVLIEVHFAAADAGRWPPTPSAISLGGDFWETTLRAGLLSQNDDASVVAALEESLRRLSDHGVLSREATARATAAPASPLVRLWSAAQPLVERFAVSSTVDDLVLGTGLSVGQVERAFQHLVSTFALAGPGLRSVTYHVRMKAAVLFLSAKDATVAEVAELVGYGSSDAMARAFREAGLPSPSAVQRSLLEDRKSATPA